MFSEACDRLFIDLLVVEGYMFYFVGVGERERCCDSFNHRWLLWLI